MLVPGARDTFSIPGNKVLRSPGNPSVLWFPVFPVTLMSRYIKSTIKKNDCVYNFRWFVA